MSEQKRMGRDLTVGSVPKLLVAFASPLFLSNLLQAVYNMVDMIVVGKYVGSVGLSAVSIGGDILHFITFIAMGFANAGQVIISQYTGAGRKDKINSLIGNMFTFLTICAVLMMIFGIILREPIMDALNTPDESRAEVRAYITVCMTGLVFIYGYNMVSAVLRGMGDSRHPFMFIAAAAVLNLVLDIFDGVIARIGLSYLFGHMLDFGYMGFWTGSEMASFVPFIVGGVYFISGKWKKKSKLIED